jgi:hypothetical protein
MPRGTPAAEDAASDTITTDPCLWILSSVALPELSERTC